MMFLFSDLLLITKDVTFTYTPIIAMACTLTLAAENIKSTFIYLGCKWNRNGKSYSDGNFDALSAFIKSLISKTFVVFSGADEEVKRQSLADEY